MASFAPPTRPPGRMPTPMPMGPGGTIPLPGRPPTPVGRIPNRGNPGGRPNPGAISPYNRRPRQQGMVSQRSLTPELLSAMARRRLGG